MNADIKREVKKMLLDNNVSKGDAAKLVEMTERQVGDKEITAEEFFSLCLENKAFLNVRQAGGAVVMTPELSQALDKIQNPHLDTSLPETDERGNDFHKAKTQ